MDESQEEKLLRLYGVTPTTRAAYELAQGYKNWMILPIFNEELYKLSILSPDGSIHKLKEDYSSLDELLIEAKKEIDRQMAESQRENN